MLQAGSDDNNDHDYDDNDDYDDDDDDDDDDVFFASADMTCISQIWTCMMFLCLASGSLIFFTSDISLTFLMCTGQEERFRWQPCSDF